jgi:Bacterial protein of unknown function (DUF903)
MRNGRAEARFPMRHRRGGIVALSRPVRYAGRESWPLASKPAISRANRAQWPATALFHWPAKGGTDTPDTETGQIRLRHARKFLQLRGQCRNIINNLDSREATMIHDENTPNAGSSFARRTSIVKMKNVLLLLLGTVCLTGCMHNYDLALVNGGRITRVSKPKLNKETGLYTFTDINGEKKSVSASRVVEIAPHSDPKVNGGLPRQ